MDYSEEYASIRTDFEKKDIPIDSPGFYDHENFIAVEKLNPEYLCNYAKFVHDRPREESYNEHVKKILPIILDIYHEKLLKNGRLGACVDISGLISRALERASIWNYVVKGSATLEFPIESGITKRYFWTLDEGEFTAAHAWVVAPPFYVVDVSLKLQPFSGKEASYLSQIICSEATKIVSPLLDDIISPAIRHKLASHNIPSSKHLEVTSPYMEKFIEVFPSREVLSGDTKVKFVPTATAASDVPFEAMTPMMFNGKTGYEVFEEEIRGIIEKA